MSRRSPFTLGLQAMALLHVLVLAASAWLRAASEPDDRGSDSTEKALMVAGGVIIAGIVFLGVKTFVNGKMAQIPGLDTVQPGG